MAETRCIDFTPNPTGPVVSVFDFDGTLFKSPAPSANVIAAYPNVLNPTFARGLGWFQSDRTLAPPIVPLTVKRIETSSNLQTAGGTQIGGGPSNTSLPYDAFDRWFIAPTVQRYVEAKARGDITAILTGREKTFEKRISQLLVDSGFAFNHLFMKRHPRGGTVAFKIDVFLELIALYKPSQIIYYEDREEQGTRIHEAMMKALVQRCSPAVAEYYSGTLDMSNPLSTVAGAKTGSSSSYPLLSECEKGKLDASDRFRMVFIDPALSDTILAEDDEDWLVAELLKDAKAEASHRRQGGGGRGRGGWGSQGGGRGSRNNNGDAK